MSRTAAVMELMALGSEDKVPYRLVLLKWKTVDYSQLKSNLDAPGVETSYFKQIAEAMPGNTVLKILILAVRQLSADKIAVLVPAMESQTLQELHVVEDRSKESLEEERLTKERERERERQEGRVRSEEASLQQSLPGEDSLKLMKSCSHVSVFHLEGIARDYAFMRGFAKVLEGMLVLKELRLCFSASESGKNAKTKEAVLRETMTETVRALRAKRTLKVLTIQRAPPGIVPALMQGIAANTFIQNLDISENNLDPKSIAALAGCVRRGRLMVLILHGNRVVKNADGETPMNALPAVQNLLRAVQEAQCKLQVFPVHCQCLPT